MNISRPEPFRSIGSASSLLRSFPGIGSRYVWLLAVLLVGLFYLLDLWTAAYFEIPISYAAALVLAVGVRGRREKIAVAASCTAMFAAEVYFIHAAAAPPTSAGLTHQGFALLLVWSVTTLGLRHHSVEADRRDSERIANERLALLNTIYTSAPVGLCFVDLNLRYLSMNAALAEMHDRVPEYFIGKTIREANPDLADTIEAYYRRVIESGKPILDIEVKAATAARPDERHSWLASYFPVYHPSGELLGVNVAARDITARKQAEADTLFLLDLADCIRFAANAEELTWVVAVALGEHVKVSRCAFLDIDTAQDRLIIRRDYHPHMPSLVGTYRLGEFGPLLTEASRAGQTTTIANVALDERTRMHIESYRRVGVGAVVAVPLLRDGAVVSALAMAHAEPRQWSEREVLLINMVAERTWLAVEKLRLDDALRLSGEALREADRRKDEFLATLAHELRNPLSLVRNVVNLQQDASNPLPDPHWGPGIIDRQVKYLTRLTDDLFDISRITREKLVFQKEPLNLAEIVRAAVESSQPLIDQRQHELTVTMSQDSIYVDADRLRLTQVFTNLLNNAAKYTPDPGHIWLNVEQAGDKVVIRVKDTGIGIAAECLPRVFELFYQVDRSFTRSEGGLGLGLTLVQQLVELHGGKVEVRSEGTNRGSEFTVQLPVTAHRPDTDDLRQNGADEAGLPVRSWRILVADDFPQSAETLARLLEKDGNEVQIAQDGVAAVEAAGEFLPDIILMDLAMPRLDGYQAAQRIRQQPWGKPMILIALTGWGQQQDRRRTQEAGFDAHLTKPVNYDAIVDLLTSLTTRVDADETRTLPN
ncbi:MAG TPA: ATP-binding protein [Candidatus Limnocylindria bacterium]|nr:ATP-binding protein [Candidatus Limnocylindria bacterium]